MSDIHSFSGFVGVVLSLCLAAIPQPLSALQPTDVSHSAVQQSIPRLTPAQAQTFRNWMTLIIHQQLRQGPTPRWQQNDCAGLVRFAVAESLREHDSNWLRANGFLGQKTPGDIVLDANQRGLRHAWYRSDGRQDAWVSAYDLVANNSRFISKDVMQAQPGDLLFYDQGQNQHLMVWMGSYIAYHTGTRTASDNGLRAYTVAQIMDKKDNRWQPVASNPNFLGVYRLTFLTPNY
ncbi:DUF1175 family protein [Hydromonas duriensis]|uniref:DUF1175 family protein n=1 Tax=Hydromonas duriensis TaxID=1527608 RepID=A0A4R6Y8S2_9BURK|nr:DUF1175 family protein [Hydromonas duriensis]TDR31813.1 hypothetical protein DFR44_10730 [Hydromonas duriensis]